MAAVAWVVALALAVGAVGVGAAASFYRRARRAEERLHSLEAATADFCSALRARVLAERDRIAARIGDSAVSGSDGSAGL